MCVLLWDVSSSHFLLTSSAGLWPPLGEVLIGDQCNVYDPVFPLAQFHCSRRFSKGSNSIFNIFFPPVRDLIPSPQGFFLGTLLPRDCCFSFLDESWGRPSLRASVHFFSLQSSGNTWRCSLHGPVGPASGGRDAEWSSSEGLYGEPKYLIFCGQERLPFKAGVITQFSEFLISTPTQSASYVANDTSQN